CMTTRNDIEQLFKAHYEQMHRLAVALLHDDDFARDIVHDVFDQLLSRTPGILITGGYLMKAVRNRCLNHIRDCEIHHSLDNRYFLDNFNYDTEDWPDDETIARIYRLIVNDISQQARRVIELRFSAGLPFARIAGIMGISETAVYRHLSHALSIIRKKLNEDEH
ncbi:MAG: sigma-70 family RNA polymerase sigma factor, partial [Muribaculaceae bacterium]|nr:sigma-70 family RNA polymerase sigma factor [Muribaculaceae bacterium]